MLGDRRHGRGQDFFRGGGHFPKNFVKIFKNIQKTFQIIFFNFKKILKKIAKMEFLAYFSKNLTNPAFNFCAFGLKTLFAGNF